LDAIVNKIVKKTLPVLLTSAAVIIALLVLRQLWVYYMDEPWTRDAHVGADVVQVAPDVSGLVETVQVADNQAVKKGDLLFVVDRARYRIALEQAKASLAERQGSVAQLRREIGRDRSLQDLVAAEDAEVRRAKLQAAQAALATAQAAVDLAELNLGRTEGARRPMAGSTTAPCAWATTWWPASRCWRCWIPARSASMATSRKPACAAWPRGRAWTSA
jgi:multidrug resistance efflux pump